MSNPFDNKPKKSGPRKVGLATPRPLTSAELAEKYGMMRHDGIEISWPMQFEDADGHLEQLTPTDIKGLAHVGVTVEEFYLIELERVQ